MTCNRSREWLALYVGGDLAPKKAEELRVHLERCENCQEFHARLDQNYGLVRALRQDVVPPAALTQVRQSLFARIDESRSCRSWPSLIRARTPRASPSPPRLRGLCS